MRHWSTGWDETHPNQQTREPPIQSEKYQCRIDTVSSPDDGHIIPETCREGEINILRSSMHLVGFIRKRLHRDVGQQSIKYVSTQYGHLQGQ